MINLFLILILLEINFEETSLEKIGIFVSSLYYYKIDFICKKTEKNLFLNCEKRKKMHFQIS